MDIQVVSTGRHFYRIEDSVGTLLLEAFPGAFVRSKVATDVQPVHAAHPQFHIGRTPYGDKPVIKLQMGAYTHFYDGPPKDAVAALRQMSGHANLEVPQDVIDGYKAMYEEPAPREVLNGARYRDR